MPMIKHQKEHDEGMGIHRKVELFDEFEPHVLACNAH